MELSFGQRISGLTTDGRELHAAVFNENEVRAAAGLTMVLGAVAFSYAYFDAQYLPLQVVSTLFFVEFLTRLTAGLRYSPMGVIARAMTLRRPPEWVSAKPKRFAWTLGLGLAFSMMIITNSGVRGMLPRTICAICLTLDVDGVGSRPVPWVQDPRPLGATRLGDQGPRVRGMRPRRVRAARAGGGVMATLLEKPGATAQERFEPAGRAPAEAAFLEANPAFRETAVLDELRATEYGRLDASGDVYLDYTGGSLYAESQLEEHLRMLRDAVYGNPHSVNPTSSAATVLVEQARAAVLRYFNAPESEYACIFTPNATGALRLVGEAYPFGPRDRFLATFDNHNSVNGIREFARAKGARTAYVPLEAPDLRVADGLLERYLDDAVAGRPQPLRLPGAVELLRRQAPAGVDRAGPGAGLGRDRRLRRVRADEPARPLGVEAGLRRRSRSTRCSATRPASAR